MLGLSNLNLTFILEIASCLSFGRRPNLIPASEGETCCSFFVFPDSLKAKKWIHNLGSVNQTGIPPSLFEFWGSNSSSQDQKRREKSQFPWSWVTRMFWCPVVIVFRVPAAAWCVQNSSGRGAMMYDLGVNYLRVIELADIWYSTILA